MIFDYLIAEARRNTLLKNVGISSMFIGVLFLPVAGIVSFMLSLFIADTSYDGMTTMLLFLVAAFVCMFVGLGILCLDDWRNNKHKDRQTKITSWS